MSKRMSTSSSGSVEVGSSMMRMRASMASALAISVICWCATESSETLVVRIDGAAHLLQQRPGRLPTGALVDEVQPPEQATPSLRVAQEDVLGDGLVGGQVELLVDDADAQPLGLVRVVDRHGLAVDADLAGIALIGAGQDLDERGLAGAVLAGEGHDLAGTQGEVDRVQRLDAAEALADAARLQQRRRAAARCPVSWASGDRSNRSSAAGACVSLDAPVTFPSSVTGTLTDGCCTLSTVKPSRLRVAGARRRHRGGTPSGPSGGTLMTRRRESPSGRSRRRRASRPRRSRASSTTARTSRPRPSSASAGDRGHRLPAQHAGPRAHPGPDPHPRRGRLRARVLRAVADPDGHRAAGRRDGLLDVAHAHPPTRDGRRR